MEGGDISSSPVIGNEGEAKVDKMVRNKWTSKMAERAKFFKEEKNGTIA
jgi:hypothetical protein